MNNLTDMRIKNAVYVVEADSFARHSLWEQCHTSHNWEEDSSGLVVEIGRFNKLPICLSIWFATIDGHLVMFYECISLLAHWGKIDEWLKNNVPSINGNHCDAMNFHNCLITLKEKDERAYQSIS